MIAVHSMMYVSQVVMLYALSSFSTLYQLYLSKTGKQQKKLTIEILIKQLHTGIFFYYYTKGIKIKLSCQLLHDM